VDRKGRHTNLVTLLDEWPELEMEMDSGLISCDDGIEKKIFILNRFERLLFTGAYCKRRNCFKRRAQNPRTTIRFDYCSLKCLRLDRTEQLERGIYTSYKYISDSFFNKKKIIFFS
jgi:hypothetical protein